MQWCTYDSRLRRLLPAYPYPQPNLRQKNFQYIAEHNLVLTTYPPLPHDQQTLLDHHYAAVVLDEAQLVKNPKSQAAQVVRRLSTEQRLCLTGTPWKII